MQIPGYIPTRFLTITAHIVITISLLWSRDANIRACLPLDFDGIDYDEKDTQFIVALSLTLFCALVELIGFFGGLSTFLPLISFLSICAHVSGTVATAFFIWDIWDCDLYWTIFVFCSALPAALEVIVILRIFVTKRI